MNLDEMETRLGEIETELRTMHEAAGEAAFTDEQQSRWDELEGELASVTTARDEARAAIERRRETVRGLASRPGHTENGDGATGAPKSPEFMRKVEPFDGADVRSMPRAEARDKALKVLENREHSGHMEDRQKEHLDRVLRKLSRNTDGSQIARRLLLTEHEDYRNAFVKMVTRTSPVLTADEARALERFDEFRAMSIGTDSGGGFGVPVLIDPTIILTAQGSPNDILNLARVEVITNDEWKGVTSAGASWSFDAEAAEVSDDSPTLAQPNVVAHKAQGFIPYSIEVGMDYPNFAGEMSTLLSEGYLELIAEKLTTGSGTNEPFGIVTALDANTNVEVTPTTDGAFGAVDLYKLWDALPIKYRNRGDRVAWMSSTDAQNEVRNFGTTLGSNFTVDLTEESIPRLFGRRYYINDFMADFTGTTGASNLLIVGDWQNYLVAQRAGMSVELVPHLLHTSNNRPSGQRGWYAWARVGADSINDLGFRILQNQ
ncbi:HK97 family phage major capsid protein [Lentzea atacamensis]|uniref:HK97 family phage major capsid protein n=1 Tax=Lentzea atacamensis TaxID=531938 RepID=A0A316I2S6_9PSEU|nr:phage major capsid protein [Lentzea atacamensis]PWK81719.1 HK97 family phage major capsid protein [Lentzea atacamensis]